MRTSEDRDKLIYEHLNLANIAAKSAWRFKIPYDEAYSIALFSLMKAASKWRGDSKFSSFYYRVSMNDFMMELREQRQKLPMDLGDGDFEISCETRLEERIDARKALVRMRKKALTLKRNKKGKRNQKIIEKLPTFIDHILNEYCVNEASRAAGLVKCTGIRLMWIIRKAA